MPDSPDPEDVHIGYALQLADTRSKRKRNLVVVLEIAAGHLQVDRSWHTHVDNSIDQAPGRKECSKLRHFVLHPLFHTSDVLITARAMTRLQAGLDNSRVHGRV